jgi:hypothetical protein
MTDYTEFFLNNTGQIVQLETFEISHPSFTKIYRVVRNATNGITVAHEDGISYEYDYYPLSIQSLGARGDLDQGFRIVMGDLGEILPNELDEVTADDNFGIKPLVRYRTYRSDDLEHPMIGPYILEIASFTFNRQASTFEAKAPSINVNKTGELYKLTRFIMLRGLL